MSNLRCLVIKTFKKLHRTRKRVFSGDERALNAARSKINEGFHKNKHVTEEEAIRAMIKFGEDVEKELKTQVIQARQVKPGVFEARINEDTAMLENIPFDENAVIEKAPKQRQPCCHNKGQNK